MTKDVKQQQDFENFVLSCESERIGQVSDKFEGIETYSELNTQQNELYSQLYDDLPENLRGKFVEYVNCCTRMLFEAQVFFYKQGFADSAVLTQRLVGANAETRLEIKVY